MNFIVWIQLLILFIFFLYKGSTTTDPCNPNPCQNSGTCTASGSSYTCNCQPGWSGTNCDLASQTCQPNPCQNGGTCYVYGGSYSCQCPPSYGGANCESKEKLRNINDSSVKKELKKKNPIPKGLLCEYSLKRNENPNWSVTKKVKQE